MTGPLTSRSSKRPIVSCAPAFTAGLVLLVGALHCTGDEGTGPKGNGAMVDPGGEGAGNGIVPVDMVVQANAQDGDNSSRDRSAQPSAEAVDEQPANRSSTASVAEQPDGRQPLTTSVGDSSAEDAAQRAAGQTVDAGAGRAEAAADESAPAEPEEGFHPCPEAEPCKVLPLGDSITFGLGAESTGGYRFELFRLAVQGGRDITFTGTQSPNGPAAVEGQPFPRNHAGISGQTIEQIAGRVPAPDMSELPHIVLVHAGTNDMFFNAAGAAERLRALVGQLVVEAPEALIVVSTIIPAPFAAEATAQYNAAVPGIVEEFSATGAHVVLVDQFEGFPVDELGDGVHPTVAGYARMGAKWFEGIEPFLP